MIAFHLMTVNVGSFRVTSMQIQTWWINRPATQAARFGTSNVRVGFSVWSQEQQISWGEKNSFESHRRNFQGTRQGRRQYEANRGTCLSHLRFDPGVLFKRSHHKDPK